MSRVPLAERMRPKTIEQIVGQDPLLHKGGLIQKTIANQKPVSLLLWGPPGCGKTTLGELYARAFSMRFIKMSAIFSGVADIKKIIKEEEAAPLFAKGTFLFVDEIHRFNKAQQDAFLPFIENGTIHLIGATTENPSFYLNNALLSRLRVLELHPLDDKAMETLIDRFPPVEINGEGRALLIRHSHGDGRYLMNLLENIETSGLKGKVGQKELEPLIQTRAPLFDRAGDQHYNLISALHKSVRGSDPNAALYWFSRMLEGGEDPLFIARRVIRMASEDIGLADPQALPQAIAAKEAYEMLGSPEGELAIAQAIVYISLAPKSNSLYTAYKGARELAAETNAKAPPKIILNAPTKLMKEKGYGKGYIYDHDTPEGCSGQNYFPDDVERAPFYEPVERGFEREMKKRLEYFEKFRN